ncbi:1225_t:CDS:10 [Paraglomus occultum]|uniref:1225_t:CDS:1 n=1 Tax=Paraglomus occultum TaxID=144539 RepID=A0A9N9B541_9GLOM|nr:1225_t:CDS:10 [Paraglomus occultum]
MSQYSRIPNSEEKEDVQVVALQVPPSSEEASTSRSTSPMPTPPTQLETEETIASTTETTPMVNQAIEEQPVSQSTYKNTNSIISGFPMLSRIRRTIASAQAAVPSSTDGVFSNLSAKPESETEKEDENPPPYEAAAADAAPPYWETTVITPGVNGDEVFVEGLPVGNFFAFVWNMLVSMSFQFVGFLLTYLLHTSHAAKNGSRAGLGITLVQYGFYLRGRFIVGSRVFRKSIMYTPTSSQNTQQPPQQAPPRPSPRPAQTTQPGNPPVTDIPAPRPYGDWLPNNNAQGRLPPPQPEVARMFPSFPPRQRPASTTGAPVYRPPQGTRPPQLTGQPPEGNFPPGYAGGRPLPQPFGGPTITPSSPPRPQYVPPQTEPQGDIHINDLGNQLSGLTVGPNPAGQGDQRPETHEQHTRTQHGKTRRIHYPSAYTTTTPTQAYPQPTGPSIYPSIPPNNIGQPGIPQGQQPMPPSYGSMVPQAPSTGPGMQSARSYPRPTHPNQALQKPRIDPNQVPSPVAVREQDRQDFINEPYLTSSKKTVPLASTDFRAIDEGNSNPRFMRLTLYSIPQTEELLKTSNLPLGLIVQPLAKLRYDETPIDVIDFGEEGPIRCRRCKSYINPFVIFVEGGQKFVCNMCQFSNEVPPEYFCNLDFSGRRVDVNQRPELLRGTVEFVVPKEYWNRPPCPLATIFAIDVSVNAVKSGMLAKCVEAIREVLYGTSNSERPGSRIGIMTFDKDVHFYNMKSSLEQAQMLVVPDVNDVFVPLSDGFLVDPVESRSVIEGLLEALPTMFAETNIAEPVLGAAVKAVYAALVDTGGKLIVFQTTLPNFGPGAIKYRDDPKLYNTEKEKTLFGPQDLFYKNLAIDCVDAGICIDLFLFPNSYVDVATIGLLSSITGGESYYYPNFNSSRDGAKFAYELRQNVTREFGYNALMRIRCSNGLKIVDHYGNFNMRNATDVELAGVDSDKAFGALFKYDGKLDEKTDAYIQCALLYTTVTGQRRVRTHNISVPVTTLLANVFRFANMDTTVSFLAKQAVSSTVTKPLREIQDQLTDKCVKILLAYRRHCASMSSPGQLILPEAFKLFPLYTLTILKCKALRAGTLASDARVHSMRTIKGMGVSECAVLLYPQMLSIHNMPEEAGCPDENGKIIKLPPLIRVSYDRLEAGGAYLLENGQFLYFWLGQQLSSEFLQGVFGVDSIDLVDPRLSALPELDNTISRRVRFIMSYLQTQRYKYLQLVIVRNTLDASEIEFNNLLVEDDNNGAMSYVEYLCYIHRQIQSERSPTKARLRKAERSLDDHVTGKATSRSEQSYSGAISLTPPQQGSQQSHKYGSLWRLSPQHFAFILLFCIRLAAALFSNIADCDEVYNYWEPLHYMEYGYGMQTWEYSPEFSIRSWAYIKIHSWTLAFLLFFLRHIFNFDKIRIFYTLRVIFAIAGTFCESMMYRTVKYQFGERVGQFFFFALMISAGMWNASTAFLPSTFTMYTTMLAFTYALRPVQKIVNRRVQYSVFWFGIGALLAWPFSAAIGIPFVIEELFISGHDLRTWERDNNVWIWNRLKRLVLASLLASAGILSFIIGVDFYYYNKFTVVPLNIVMYNVFGGKDRGPDIYGVEPWHYYLFNGCLNFNFLFILALGSLPILAITFFRDFGRIEAASNTANPKYPYVILLIRLVPFYLWLLIFTLQPHKEERFLFVAYPLVCLNASIALFLMRSWLSSAFVYFLPKYKGNKKYNRMCTTVVTVIVFIIAGLTSFSRVLALYHYYHAPYSLYEHFYRVEIPQQLDSQTLRPTYTNPINMCVGKEWYRFPSHYFLPEGVRLRFLKSDFSGQLPQYFLESVEKNSEGQFTINDKRDGTWKTRSGFNDRNKEEMGRYVYDSQCDYLVDLDLNVTKTSPLEPRYVTQTDKWTIVRCYRFLDKDRSSMLGRILYVPASVWGNEYIKMLMEMFNSTPLRWADYCLLKRKGL